MPLYEYQCNHCGKVFEIIQKFADDPLSECELCGGKLERLLSAPAIQFKGNGWYVTDYGGKNGKDPTSATNSAKSSSENSKENAQKTSKSQSDSEKKTSASE